MQRVVVMVCPVLLVLVVLCVFSTLKNKVGDENVSLSLLALTAARSFMIRVVFELLLAELKKANVSVAVDESRDTAQQGVYIRFLDGKSF